MPNLVMLNQMPPTDGQKLRKRDKVAAFWKTRKAANDIVGTATQGNRSDAASTHLADRNVSLESPRNPPQDLPQNPTQNLTDVNGHGNQEKSQTLLAKRETEANTQVVKIIQPDLESTPLTSEIVAAPNPNQPTARSRNEPGVHQSSVTISDLVQSTSYQNEQLLPSIDFLTPSSAGTLSDKLWQRAYSNLKTQEPELAQALQVFLLAKQETFHGANQLGQTIKTILDERDARQWAVNIAGKKIKIREQAEKIVRFILWSSDYVSAVVSTQPYASLAWTGVTLLLPLVLNHTEQNEALLDGLSFSTDLIPSYKVYEDIYLLDKPNDEELENRIVNVYTRILAYQGRVVVYCGRRSLSTAMRDIVKADGWVDLKAQIEKANERCRAYTGEVDKQQEAARWVELFSHFQKTSVADAELLKAVHELRDAQQQVNVAENIRKCLECLSSKYEEHKNVNPKRVPGTCEWFLHNQHFQKWRQQNTSALLWVTADPGCGKSVLSRYLIDDNLLGSSITASTVGYFFFKDGLEGRTQPYDALSAILHSILTSMNGPEIINHALPSFERHGTKLAGMFSELWRMLLDIAQDANAGEVVCVVDALDECQPAAREVFIDALVDFYIQEDLTKKTGTRLKFLITSRPYPEIADRFDSLDSSASFVHFDGMEETNLITKDINLVIDARVPQVARHASPNVQKEIIQQLKQFEHRTYLWLYLMLNEIETNIKKYNTKSRAAGLIHSLPKSINDAYTAILGRSTDPTRAAAMLQIIIGAIRPLTVAELNVATEISLRLDDDNCDSYEALDCTPEDSFRSSLPSICGLFITVHDSKAYLIHQTAREFLLATNNMGEQRWYHLREPRANFLLSRICLMHLRFQEFSQGLFKTLRSFRRMPKLGEHDINRTTCLLNKQEMEHDIEERKDSETSISDENEDEHEHEYVDHDDRPVCITCYLRCHPLLQYSSLHWMRHFRLDIPQEQELMLRDAMELCNVQSSLFRTWFQIYMCSESIAQKHWTRLAVASSIGISALVSAFFADGDHINGINTTQENADCISALTAASSQGHLQVVELLLAKGADADLLAGKRWKRDSALAYAIGNGHADIVEILVRNGASTSLPYEDSGNSLQFASFRGNEKIISLLIQYGADVNAQGGYYGNVLQAAAWYGKFTTVQLLLSHGADINAVGGGYGTALQAAAHTGDLDTVQLLIKQGANINAGDEYSTAIQAAASWGYLDIVELLINYGADINAKGGFYGPALEAAACSGNRDIVQLLIDHGADVNARGGRFGTAIQAAAIRGHLDTVQLLINHGADVNSKGGSYSIALQAALNFGNDEIAKLLRDHGALEKESAEEQASDEEEASDESSDIDSASDAEAVDHEIPD